MNYSSILKDNKWLILILAIASALRFYHLDFQSAWLDEIYTLRMADPKLTINELHQSIMIREGIPHFYFLIVKYFNIIAGHNIFYVRVVSALCGVISIYIIYLLGKELFSKQIGVISAILLTVNPFHIEYSQEGRSYTMMLLFVLLAYYFLTKYIKSVSYKNAFYIGAFCGLITNTHPIGIVNVIGIFLVLFFYLLTRKTLNQKIEVAKHSLLAGITTLIVFYPVYQIVLKLTLYKSFWVQKPSFDYVIQVLTQVSGYSKLFLLLSVVSIIVWFFYTIKIIIRNKNIDFFENPETKTFIIIFFWIAFFIGFMIIKSIMGNSLILHRYFISLLPAFIILNSWFVLKIKNLKLQYLLVGIVSVSFLFFNIKTRNYYNTLSKSQYDLVSDEIKKSKFKEDNVVSNWGWLMGFYFHDAKNQSLTTEISLENYVSNMMYNEAPKNSFWYIDGNSRPYSLGVNAEAFLKNNFVLTSKINKFDSWARHYKSRSNEVFLDLKKFNPSMFDGTGTMIFVQNLETTYPPFSLEKGSYIIVIRGQSLPLIPINDENAHFNVLVNDIKIKDFYLDSRPNSKALEMKYEHQGGNLSLKLQYDNDLVINNLDRNAMMFSINIKKL